MLVAGLAARLPAFMDILLRCGCMFEPRIAQPLIAPLCLMSQQEELDRDIARALECKWKFKSEQCRFFRNGTCKRGELCTYAHWRSEVRPAVSKELYKEADRKRARYLVE
jgi:hypothetical protein